MSVLDKICRDKAAHILARKEIMPLNEIEDRAQLARPPRGFALAIKEKQQSGQAAIIAEVKKASPSKGVICTDFDPITTAQNYQDLGASCVSVLTDAPYFQGSDDDFEAVRGAIELPMIRKDFMIDPYQIIESRAMGADCILLIMAALSDDQAAELTDTARRYDMDILFETHNSEEIERCKSLSPEIIGVNSRDLKTLDVDLNSFTALYSELPDTCLKIAESGIKDAGTVNRLLAKGYDGFLIGESFMRGVISPSDI